MIEQNTRKQEVPNAQKTQKIIERYQPRSSRLSQASVVCPTTLLGRQSRKRLPHRVAVARLPHRLSAEGPQLDVIELHRWMVSESLGIVC
jgi:hypothetical protein